MRVVAAWSLPRRAWLVVSVAVSLIAALAASYYVRDRLDAPPQTLSASHVFSYYVQPDDWKPVARDAQVVVLGTIVELLPAVWTTRDEQPPPPSLRSEAESHYQIRTPARLSVERVFKGPQGETRDSITFNFFGGTVGEVTVKATEGEGMYRQGGRVLLFLSKPTPRSPADLPNSEYWPIEVLRVEGEIAHGQQKPVPLSEVLNQLEQTRP